ncbi:hypothetical protein JCM16106_15450 [Hydrogenophilus islandicus]
MAGDGTYLTTPSVAPAERRRHQRIYVALVSPRRFQVDLAHPGGAGLPVYDLSLGGFSCGRPPTLPEGRFTFTLRYEGDPAGVSGEAEVRTIVSDGRIGCEIVAIEADARERLVAWLVAYILANARVRLSDEEARAIVEGNSFL